MVHGVAAKRRNSGVVISAWRQNNRESIAQAARAAAQWQAASKSAAYLSVIETLSAAWRSVSAWRQHILAGMSSIGGNGIIVAKYRRIGMKQRRALYVRRAARGIMRTRINKRNILMLYATTNGAVNSARVAPSSWRRVNITRKQIYAPRAHGMAFCAKMAWHRNQMPYAMA